MELKAKRVPYSSTVGGGVIFTDETGKACYQIAIFGTTNGITKEVTDFIGDRIVEQWNEAALSRAEPAAPSEAIDLEALVKECIEIAEDADRPYIKDDYTLKSAVCATIDHLSTRYPAMFKAGKAEPAAPDLAALELLEALKAVMNHDQFQSSFDGMFLSPEGRRIVNKARAAIARHGKED